MRFILALIASVFFALPALANDDLAVTPSKYPVYQTIGKIESYLRQKGVVQVSRFSHTEAAKRVGQTLKPTELVVFGQAKIGTPLIQANRLLAADWPLRVLVFEDDNGKAFVAVIKLEVLKVRYKLEAKEAELKELGDLFDGIAKVASE